MAHITFRIDDGTISRIDALRAPRKITRSAALKELIALGLEVSVGGFAPVHDAIGRANAHLEVLQELVAESTAGGDDRLRTTQEALEAQLELITKLGIETVMISRSLALARGRPFLADAQQAARDYFANRTANGADPAERDEPRTATA
jgi:hypothetical protein